MALLTRFITELLDDPVLAQDVKQFLTPHEELDMGKLASHPTMVLNMKYSLLWNLVFKTWPTKMDFADYRARTGHVHPDAHDFKTIAQTMSFFSVVQTDLNAIGNAYMQLLSNLGNPEFVREKILEKWHYRFGPEFPAASEFKSDTTPLIYIFAKYVKASHVTLDPTAPFTLPSGNIDPNPNFIVADIHPTSDREAKQYIAHRDMHFIRLAAAAGVISAQADLKEVTEAAEEFTGQKAIVLKNSSDPLWEFYPRIARFSIGPLNLGGDHIPGISSLIPVNIDEIGVPAQITNGLKQRFFKAILKRDPELPFLHFMMKYLYKRRNKLKELINTAPMINKELKKKCAVIIDNRPNPLTAASVYMAALNLDPAVWDIRVYTSSKATQYYTEAFKTVASASDLIEPNTTRTTIMTAKNDRLRALAEVVEYTPLNINKFNIDTYNEIMMSTQFWDTLAIQYETALIIQDDGVIVRPGVDTFTEWDYVGAPWADAPDNEYIKKNVNPQLVGNGGFSIRSVKSARDICARYNPEKNYLFWHNMVRTPEDVYFVGALSKQENRSLYKVAPREVALKFASEQIITPGCIGFHKCWLYNHPEQLRMYFDSILADY
jgi:hypothetical protein